MDAVAHERGRAIGEVSWQLRDLFEHLPIKGTPVIFFEEGAWKVRSHICDGGAGNRISEGEDCPPSAYGTREASILNGGEHQPLDIEEPVVADHPPVAKLGVAAKEDKGVRSLVYELKHSFCIQGFIDVVLVGNGHQRRVCVAHCEHPVPGNPAPVGSYVERHIMLLTYVADVIARRRRSDEQIALDGLVLK